MVQRQHHGTGVQPDPAGPGGEGRGQDGGVGEERAEGVEVPFGEPQGVEAALVGEVCGGHDQAVFVVVGVLGVVAEEVEAEVDGS